MAEEECWKIDLWLDNTAPFVLTQQCILYAGEGGFLEWTNNLASEIDLWRKRL